MKAGFPSGTDSGSDESRPADGSRFVPPRPSELAQLFPHLEIQTLLGQGGMGAVYKARQPALDRFVALKILPSSTVADSGFSERFTREARALARLNHPNIVGVFDFGQAGNLNYFIMEFVDGVNLRQLEHSGRISPREALQIIPQICDALQYAHDEGIVHRDIKPENVLVDRKGRVKIADFGLAKILGRDPRELRLTREGQLMGTPHYMAPEQVEKPQTVDHRADIYSLGVVFYEMLTGELPLGKFAAPSKKVQVDVRLDEVVLHALEKEPELRYQQASQVKTAVETIAGTEKTREDPTQRNLSPVTNPRHSQFALGLFLAGTLGALLLMTISPRHEMALIFGGVALVLAFVFGLLGWKQGLGKGVAIATLVIFSGIGITAVVLTGSTNASRHAAKDAASRQQTDIKAAAKARLEEISKSTASVTPHGPEGTPPVVISTVPESGMGGIDPALTEIRVTFSKDMMTDRMWAFSQVSKETFPERTGQIHYLADKRTCVMPVKLEPGTTYVIWLNLGRFNSFRDTQNNPALPYLLIFETRK